MEKWQVVILLFVGLLLLGLSVFLRARYGERFELRTIDLVLIVLPLLFALLVTGKLKVFDAFGIRADFSELFAEAAGTTIEDQVESKLSPEVDDVVTMLQMATKGGVNEIPKLIEQRTEALVFRLGHGGYYGPAIEKYFEKLYASSYLQYLIVTEPDGKLFGIYDVLDLSVYFRSDEGYPYEDFANWLNSASGDDRERLKTLPGFVGVDQAIKPDLSKREALKRMDRIRADSLPVVDSRSFFIGTVSRSQLTASLILEVVNRMEQSASS